MDYFKLRYKLDTKITADIRKMLNQIEAKNIEYLGKTTNPNSGENWKINFRFVLDHQGHSMVAGVVLFIESVDDLFNPEAYWITDRNARIDTRKQNYDQMTLARIRVLRLVYSMYDDLTNDYEEISKGYKLEYNRAIQCIVSNTGTRKYSNV